MPATASTFRDGPDLVIGFAGVPAGFDSFGEARGGRVWVQCDRLDLMPLRAALDWLGDLGVDVAGLGEATRRKLGYVS